MKVLSLSSHGTTNSQIFIDNSPSAKTIYVDGNTLWDSTQYIDSPNSIRFDGSGDRLRMLDSDDFALGSVYSISFFIKRNTITRQMIFGQSIDSSSGFNGIRSEFNTTSWYVYANNTAWSTGCVVSDTVWHHLELCSDGTNMYSFLDGVKKGTRSTIIIGNSAAQFVIGEQTASSTGVLFLNAWVWKFEIYKNECLHTVNFVPNPTGRLFLEQFTSLRIASVAETFRYVQVDPAHPREAWRGIQVRKATPAEKAYEIYVDAAARLEKAAQLSVIATMGFEQFSALSVNGTLAAFEQFVGLGVEARERMVFETYRRLAVLGEVDSSVFQQSVGLIIDNSVVEFMSFQEQIGLYYQQFDVAVNVHPDTFPPRNVQLIRSLPLYASASLVLQSTLLLPSGPVQGPSRIICLMYDGVQDEGRSLQKNEDGKAVEVITATLRLVSPTAGLGYLKGDSGSQWFSKSWPSGTMASGIMDELFAGSGLSYDLRIDDFPIGQQLVADNEFPFQIWPKIFIKERVHTGDDGDTLIIDRMLPFLPKNIIIDSTAALRSAIAAAPLTHNLDPGQYMVQSTIADDGGQVRYNMIRVANYQDADAGAAELAAPELGEADSSGMTTVYGWPVPWRKVWLRGCHLPHDGYELRAEGVAEELEFEETISFDGGVGRTQRPIHALLSVDWAGNVSLGAVTPSEDGTLTAATAGKSVAVVRYKTRRYNFLYRDGGQHETDVWLTDEED